MVQSGYYVNFVKVCASIVHFLKYNARRTLFALFVNGGLSGVNCDKVIRWGEFVYGNMQNSEECEA